MVKGVVTSIITAAVLMCGLVGCGYSDSENTEEGPTDAGGVNYSFKECTNSNQEMCWNWNPTAEENGCGVETDDSSENTAERLENEYCWIHKVYRPYVSVEPPSTVFESIGQEQKNRSQKLIDYGWNSPLDTPATYFLTSDLSPDSLNIVKSGIQAAENYLGAYGPMRVYVIGSDTSATEAAIQDYCNWSYNTNEIEMCENDQGIGIYEMAYYEGSNAFAQHSRHRSEPTQAFVIGNPLGIGPADGSKVAAHEYVHIYTQAHQMYQSADLYGLEWPIWIEEGSAEFLALYLADQEGWLSFRERMEESLRTTQSLRELIPNLTIKDLAADRDRVREYCGLCFGQLQYDTGQWATAWLVHHSSLDAFFFDFFPNAYDLGIDGAFETAFNLTIDEFYAAFEKFLELPISEQMAILPTP